MVCICIIIRMHNNHLFTGHYGAEKLHYDGQHFLWNELH